MPAATDFLLNFNEDEFNIEIRARDYYSFFALTSIAVGILFQIPIGILAITRLGIFTPQQIAANRRYAILVIAVLAMLLPGHRPDHDDHLDGAAGASCSRAACCSRASSARRRTWAPSSSPRPRRRPSPSAASPPPRPRASSPSHLGFPPVLFDLQSPGRRRVIKVVYAMLAILLAVGLVGFGIGSDATGGISDDLQRQRQRRHRLRGGDRRRREEGRGEPQGRRGAARAGHPLHPAGRRPARRRRGDRPDDRHQRRQRVLQPGRRRLGRLPGPEAAQARHRRRAAGRQHLLPAGPELGQRRRGPRPGRERGRGPAGRGRRRSLAGQPRQPRRSTSTSPAGSPRASRRRPVASRRRPRPSRATTRKQLEQIRPAGRGLPEAGRPGEEAGRLGRGREPPRRGRRSARRRLGRGRRLTRHPLDSPPAVPRAVSSAGRAGDS